MDTLTIDGKGQHLEAPSVVEMKLPKDPPLAVPQSAAQPPQPQPVQTPQPQPAQPQQPTPTPPAQPVQPVQPAKPPTAAAVPAPDGYPHVAAEASPAYAHFTEPSHVAVGTSAAFALKVRGHAFQEGDEIVFERVNKSTTFVDTNTLVASISPEDLPKEPTQLNVAVRRGKVDSRPAIFTVELPQ